MSLLKEAQRRFAKLSPPFQSAVVLTGGFGGVFLFSLLARPSSAISVIVDGKEVVPSSELERAAAVNLEVLNTYRAAAGAGPLTRDAQIDAFARDGSAQLARDHAAHAHFQAEWKASDVFGNAAAENQGDPRGWDLSNGATVAVKEILQAMMDEGPGGGHHDNILNARYRRVGIGLVVEGDKLYFTNDFGA